MTPIIDREIFFGNPEITGGQLSPDGKFMAFIKPLDGVRNIWIKAIDAPFSDAKPVTSEKSRPIPNFFWSKDSQYLLYYQDKGGNEDFHLFAVNPHLLAENQPIPEAKDLTPADGVRAVVFHLSKTDPDTIFLGMNQRDRSWHDLYRVSISKGTQELIYENQEQINNYIFDLTGKLRLGNRSTEDGGTELLLYKENTFQVCLATPFEESSDVLRFHKDGRRVYMETNKGKALDLSQLVLFDPETGEEQFLESDPEGKVDFGNALFSEKTDELLATTYNGAKPRKYFRDPVLEADFNYLKTQLPNVEINFGTCNKEEDLWVVYATSDVDPGATYLYDRNTKTLTFQYRPRPKLPVQDLAFMEPVTYKSFDGLEIQAYLTIPKYKTPNKYPAILLIHGGPWTRDFWGYDPFAQFLANRGYVVLQPNYRGSTGFGKRFLNAANGQWGRTMQDDISAGVKYLTDNSIADAKRIGIVGGSYGGYATLAGLTFTPELYAAGVSIVGPSNLLTLLESIPPYWETIRQVFYRRMGDPGTEAGVQKLKDQSPLFHAKKIRAPLLVVQGANDPRVKQAESDQIVYAMKTLGLPVEYIVAPDEGHGFARPENTMAFIAAMEKFLSAHLGGRYQKEIPPNIQKRLDEITVNIDTVAPGASQKA